MAALTRAAERCLLPPGSRVLLAVSGGADSMALFSGSLEVARETGWRLSVAHVHHGLRGREADRDLAFVQEHARRGEVPFFVRRCDAAAAARSMRISPEAAARHVRYEALREMAREAGASRIAVAHHKGDVAESLLLARRRKGGPSALGGPRERRADGIVRPLLSVTREEILAHLSAHGVLHRRDASNGDLRFERNRLRYEIARAAEPAEAIDRLVAEAATFALERQRLDRDFEEQAGGHLISGPEVTLADAAWLAGCSGDLARRALERAAMPFARPGLPAFTGREREQILARLASGSDFRFEAGRRIRFERRGGLLRILPRPDRAPRVDTARRPA